MDRKEPLNLVAIRKWVNTNRPDLSYQLDGIAQADALILLMTIGFEAGRQFQVEHPNIPLNEPMYYANFS